ncbi:MAG: hypothetical protein ACREF3_13810 [Acetobacteraceae bacterium]
MRQVLDFYGFRDTNPNKVYPRAAAGTVQKYEVRRHPRTLSYQFRYDRSALRPQTR